jgi:3-oxoacyl-[acyl-carrier-protein] synthase III
MKVLKPNLKLKVLGQGRSWPGGKPLSNYDLLKAHPDTADKPEKFLREMEERIFKVYGFKNRYLSHFPGTPMTDAEDTAESLGERASRLALGSGKPSAFVMGTTTTRRYTGSQATSILGKLGIEAPSFEMKAGCSTSLASLTAAQALLSHGYPDVLVCCAETLSKVIHPGVRETWFGLADAGAAVWLERNDAQPDFEVLRTVYSTDGKHVDLYTTPGQLPPRADVLEAGGYYIGGDSSALKDLALKRYVEMIEALLPDPKERSSVRWIIPHQVNRQLIDEVQSSMKLGGDRVWSADDFGNVGGTSVLFSLAQGLEKQIFKPGELVLLMSVGGGLSFAAQLWRSC